MQELITTNTALCEKNNRLSMKIEELEEHQRSNNLEIKGLPLEADENDAQWIPIMGGQSEVEAKLKECGKQ